MRMTISVRVGVATAALAVVAAVTLAARQSGPARPGQPGAALAALPPLNTAGYALARPLAITRAVYEFAAEHPEVSSYVPVLLRLRGRRTSRQRGVLRRRARRTTATSSQWDAHGVGCAVCIDVARDAMQMYRSGADPAAIRAAIEKKWTPQYQTKTPTPPVPAEEAADARD